MIPADFIVLGAGLAFAVLWLHARNRRAARTLGLLVLAFVAGAVALSGDAQFVVKSAVIVVYAVIVLFVPRALGLLSTKDRNIDGELSSIMKPVRSAIGAWERDPSVEAMLATGHACDVAIVRLASLEPPPRHWRTTLELARRYIFAVRDLAKSNDPATPTGLPPSAAGPALESLARQVDDAWRNAILQ